MKLKIIAIHKQIQEQSTPSLDTPLPPSVHNPRLAIKSDIFWGSGWARLEKKDMEVSNHLLGDLKFEIVRLISVQVICQ